MYVCRRYCVHFLWNVIRFWRCLDFVAQTKWLEHLLCMRQMPSVKMQANNMMTVITYVPQRFIFLSVQSNGFSHFREKLQHVNYAKGDNEKARFPVRSPLLPFIRWLHLEMRQITLIILLCVCVCVIYYYCGNTRQECIVYITNYLV